jgi:hypothetical protein
VLDKSEKGQMQKCQLIKDEGEVCIL